MNMKDVIISQYGSAYWDMAERITGIAKAAAEVSRTGAGVTMWHNGRIHITLPHADDSFTFNIAPDLSFKDNLASLAESLGTLAGKGNRRMDIIAYVLSFAGQYADGDSNAFEGAMDSLRESAKEGLWDKMVEGLRAMQELGISSEVIRKELQANAKELAQGLPA